MEKLAYATKEQVMAAVAEFNGIQYVNLADATIPPAVIELVPESVARENVVLPFTQEGPVLKIVMSDPTDVATMEKLQFILNKQITPLLAPKEQIIEAINRHYGQSETESVDSMLAEFTDTAIDFTETESMPRPARTTVAATSSRWKTPSSTTTSTANARSTSGRSGVDCPRSNSREVSASPCT